MFRDPPTVSTDGQTTANQERELRAAAERIGHEIVAVYRDAGISGSKGRDQRPGFDAMHKTPPVAGLMW
jgi:DNA invertase Pin-like site-specific DNA recombinase